MTTKEAVMGVAGVVGYKETVNRKYMSGEVIMTPDFPIQALNNMINGTITLESATAVATLTGAWLDGDISADAVEGKINLVFAGTDLVWS
jgi:hypothetical protein